MKKRNLVIVIAAAVALVLGVTVWILLSRGEETTVDPNQDPYAAVSRMVTDLPASRMAAVEAKNFPNAPDFKVTVQYDSSTDSYKCVMQNNPEGYYYSDTYMNLMVATLEELEAASVAASGDVNLQDYGITDKSITYVIEGTGGEKLTVRLGAQTPLGSGYYITRDGSETVYIISNYQGSTLERDVYEMRSIVIYPDMESYMDLYRLRIEYPDGSVVDSRQLSEAEIAAGASWALFKFTEPLEIGINDDVAKSNYYEASLNLSVRNVVQDNTEGLEKFGLDKPTVIRYVNDEGAETTLYLGNNVEGDVRTRYGMLKGADCVFTVYGSFDFLTLDIYDLVDTTIWIHNIDDIRTVRLTGGGKKYELFIDSFTNDEDASDYRFYAEMDKVSKDETSVRRLYMELVSLPTLGTLQSEGIDPETLRGKAPDYRLETVYDDGSEHYIDFYAINDMQLAADVDGNMLFFTSRSQIVKILDYFEMLKNDEEIPEI